MQIVPIDPETAAAQVRWTRLANNQRAAWLRAALKEAARKQGVSEIQQGELAEMLNLTPQTLSAWMNGKADIDWSRRMSVLVALGLPQLWEPSAPLPPAMTAKQEPRPKRRAAH